MINRTLCFFKEVTKKLTEEDKEIVQLEIKKDIKFLFHMVEAMKSYDDGRFELWAEEMKQLTKKLRSQ